VSLLKAARWHHCFLLILRFMSLKLIIYIVYIYTLGNRTKNITFKLYMFIK